MRQRHACSTCGILTRIPFVPKYDTPILCPNCYRLKMSREFMKNGPPSKEEPRTPTVKAPSHFGAYPWR